MDDGELAGGISRSQLPGRLSHAEPHKDNVLDGKGCFTKAFPSLCCPVGGKVAKSLPPPLAETSL